MAGTVADFWSMIWEQKVTVVVMVTQLRERDKEKCFQYWPINCGEEEPFGDVTVKMVKVRTIGWMVLGFLWFVVCPLNQSTDCFTGGL